MSVSTSEFWNLLRESRLLSPKQVDALGQEYAQLNGAAQQGNAKTLSQWLLSRKAVTPYQSTILLAGRSGPFFYGQYKVYDRIEGGPAGGLFRAWHVPTRHPVLLEFVSGPAAQDAGMWRLIADNAAAHEALVHPQFNRCYETCDLGTFKFAALEDVRGEAVEARLARSPLPPGEACRVARAAALALAQLHMAGLVHADVRPHNLWIEPTGNVKLLRDPLALPASLALLEQTSPEKIAARADYLAPELSQQGKKPDALTDLYALGCALYQMLAGRPPFAGGEVSRKLQRHAGEPIQPLEQQGVPQPIAQIVTYLMAKNPTVRYQQAMVVAEQLTPFCDAGKLLVQPPAPPPTLAAYENHLRGIAAPETRTAATAGPAVFNGGAPPSTPFPGATDAPAAASGAAAAATGASADGSGGAPLLVNADDPRRRVRKAGGARLSQAMKDPESLLTRQNMIYAASGLTALVLLLVVGIVIAMNAGNKKDAGSVEKPVAVNGGSGAADGTTGGAKGGPASDVGSPGDSGPVAEKTAFVEQSVIPDDGQALWATPTLGGPVSLDYVPSGSKLFLIVRPADIAAGEEGDRVLRGLGPAFESLRQRWESACGFKLDELEQVIVTLHGGESAELRPAFVVRPKAHVSETELVSRWGNPASADSQGTKYYKAASGWAFYLPPGEDAKVFTMASEQEIADVIEKRGAPLLDLQLQEMLKTTDADRHVNLIFEPFLLSNEQGLKLFAGPLAKLRPELASFVGDDIRIALLSLHFGDPFYLELRAIGNGAKDRYQLASELRGRLAAMPSEVEEYVVRLEPPLYWRKLAIRVPGWVRDLGSQTRVATEQNQAVVNAVLPGYAASNLVVAAELMISSAPGAGPVAAVAGPKKKTPQTVEELLAVETSIEFPQHDLINAVALVRQDLIDTYPDLPFSFEIKMMGSQLMEEGATQNQAVRDFKMQDKTVAEILTAMMMKANTVPTVKSPTEEDQKLVWVVAPDSSPTAVKLLITTRKAAKREGYTLPAVFQSAGN